MFSSWSQPNPGPPRRGFHHSRSQAASQFGDALSHLSGCPTLCFQHNYWDPVGRSEGQFNLDVKKSEESLDMGSLGVLAQGVEKS